MTTALYEIETRGCRRHHVSRRADLESRRGRQGARLLAYSGLYITGIGGAGDDGAYPATFVALGHQTWSAIIEEAAGRPSSDRDQ
ncbi:hypothetical protein [Streptomyces sp. NBC_00271]|uniref:hypothetical protein n=1 Tax=Streptomyces sp. NBC_00271 TaxID=2975697 RepID=UPI002E2B8B27|nr:hypothetical protein [Streptomyces sp. NBC_00271]